MKLLYSKVAVSNVNDNIDAETENNINQQNNSSAPDQYVNER